MINNSSQSREHIIPSPHIARFFLYPDYLMGTRIVGKDFFQFFARERIEHFYPYNSDVFIMSTTFVCKQVNSNFPTTKYDTSDLIRTFTCSGIINDRLEGTIGQILQLGRGKRMA